MFYYEEDEILQIYLDAPLPMTELDWPQTVLSNMLPIPETLIGNIRSNNSERFSVYIDNVTDNEFNAYVDECINKGFNEDFSRYDDYYRAFDKNGYRLVVEKEIFDQMYISIEAPEEE